MLIINDRLDLALAAEADGVHLGQEDLPLHTARKILGEKSIIGISTHDEEQALAAQQGGADYIGFGPMFGTGTKKTGYTPRGLEQLRIIRSLVRLPIVAIGGITEERASQVLAAGANGDLATDGPLRTESERRPDVPEVVPTDGERNPWRDGERNGQQLVVVVEEETELVAALEL